MNPSTVDCVGSDNQRPLSVNGLLTIRFGDFSLGFGLISDANSTNARYNFQSSVKVFL